MSYTLKVHRLMNDDDYVKYTGKECVSAKRDGDYFDEMSKQHEKLKEKLEAEGWTVKLKTYTHDFGMYVDVHGCYKLVEVSDFDVCIYDDDDVEFIGNLSTYGIDENEVDYEEIVL